MPKYEIEDNKTGKIWEIETEKDVTDFSGIFAQLRGQTKDRVAEREALIAERGAVEKERTSTIGQIPYGVGRVRADLPLSLKQGLASVGEGFWTTAVTLTPEAIK